METSTYGISSLYSTTTGPTDAVNVSTAKGNNRAEFNATITYPTTMDLLNNSTWSNATELANFGNDSWIYNQTQTGNIPQGNFTERCEMIKKVLQFDHIQVARVVVTWILFFISSVGNLFVLSCVYRKAKMSHVHLIMLHFTLADLAFTFMVMPSDAVWNTTMEWKVGEFLCRTCQMFKQMGMYISSFMVVVLALDRCCSILQPMSTPIKQRRRTKFLVGGAWILSILSAIPPAVIFTVSPFPFCPDRPPFLQCVDFVVVREVAHRRPYYFFTMFMSFILPMIFTVVSYSLVVGEISNMMRRDRVMMGRRDSCHNITRARRKTLFITSMVTLSFLCFWGPYYGFGIYTWFHEATQTPREVSVVLFLLMYVHPAIHPILYGVLMKDVRVKFGQTMSRLEQFVTCNTTETRYGEKTLNCLSSSRKSRGSISNGYLRTETRHEIPCAVGDEPAVCENRTRFPTGQTQPDEMERRRLLSANEELCCDPLPVRGEPVARPKRCSTVTFNLNLSDSAVENDGVWNNNNEKILEMGSTDSVFKSTIL